MKTHLQKYLLIKTIKIKSNFITLKNQDKGYILLCAEIEEYVKDILKKTRGYYYKKNVLETSNIELNKAFVMSNKINKNTTINAKIMTEFFGIFCIISSDTKKHIYNLYKKRNIEAHSNALAIKTTIIWLDNIFSQIFRRIHEW